MRRQVETHALEYLVVDLMLCDHVHVKVWKRTGVLFPGKDRYNLNRLKDKVAIVVGAGSQNEGIGNGRASAILFAREGARVLLVDANGAMAEQTRSTIVAEGGEAVVFEADVTDPAVFDAMVRDAVSRWGRLDILVNNVGTGVGGTVLDLSVDAWDHVMRVNVTAMMLACKAAIPAMVNGGGGSIVNIASIAAMRPRGIVAYATSKSAVITLSKALAADHGPQGIRVNAIAPGLMYTPFVSARGMDPDLRERRRKSSALQSEGTGWDTGYAALFLASDEARYVSGIVLPVDGGSLAYAPLVN